MSTSPSTMRRSIFLIAATVCLTTASLTQFSVHDDILAFPQYEVVFSDSYISEDDAEALLARASQPSAPAVETKDVEPPNKQKQVGDDDRNTARAGKETYETLWLHDQQYLCTIPIVNVPQRNETSEAEARAEEQRELVRATSRGWELLQDLDGKCLYFISGWWSYAFCYNKEVTQFHQLPLPPGKGHLPPQRDPTTKQFILGRVQGDGKAQEDDYGNEIELRKGSNSHATPQTEMQAKGDTRYLIQRLDSGTICDLTGKPRRVEVQYHCSPQAGDRIGWIKEVTTCSYVMVVYTPRLCGDIAFQPPKEVQANSIACRMILPEDEVSYWIEHKTIEAEHMMEDAKPENTPIDIGGVVIGAKKHTGEDGTPLPAPKGWQNGQAAHTPAVDTIARSKSKADGGKVEVLSDEELQKLDLDPKVVEQLKKELEKMAGDKGWKLEVIEVPGDTREIRGIVDGDEEDEEYVAAVEDGRAEEGSEETYKEEL